MQIKGPVRGFFYAHKAIRTELSALANLAGRLDPNANIDEFEDRLEVLHILVKAHAGGEEDGFYPGLDRVRKDISKAYIWDHKLDEELFESIKKSIARIKSNGKPSDIESLRMDMLTLKATLSAHAQKEDDLLVPLADAEMPLSEQSAIAGKVVAGIPPHLMERIFKRIVISALTTEERADQMGMMKKELPPEVFQTMVGWLREALSANDWKDLVQITPELAQ
jgi:hypothetical protein